MDRRATAALEDRLQALELERSQLEQRVDVLQKVSARLSASIPAYAQLSVASRAVITPPRRAEGLPACG